jgi:SulP family sulfate permease
MYLRFQPLAREQGIDSIVSSLVCGMAGCALVGQVFFVSTIYFRQGFDLHYYPARISIDIAEDHKLNKSGVTALDQVIRKMKLKGSFVEVQDLNCESLNLFARIGIAPKRAGEATAG